MHLNNDNWLLDPHFDNNNSLLFFFLDSRKMNMKEYNDCL